MNRRVWLGNWWKNDDLHQVCLNWISERRNQTRNMELIGKKMANRDSSFSQYILFNLNDGHSALVTPFFFLFFFLLFSFFNNNNNNNNNNNIVVMVAPNIVNKSYKTRDPSSTKLPQCNFRTWLMTYLNSQLRIILGLIMRKNDNFC